VIADRVDGLVIEGNNIVKANQKPQLYPNAPLFEFRNSNNILIKGNNYTGSFNTAIKADAQSSRTLISERNKGF
jgi:hypothetical protein